MPENIKTSKIDRNTKIPEDLGAVIYNITDVLETFGNDLKQLKKNKNITKNKKIRNISYGVS